MILRINYAYEVLSDSEKRGIYDTLGDNGVKLREHPETILNNPEVIQKVRHSRFHPLDWPLVSPSI